MDGPTAQLLNLLGQACIAGGVTVVLAWMNQRTKKAIDKNTTITKTVHALVNNAMGIQLKTTANALRTLANFSRDPTDRKAADAALRLYDEHMSGQEAIDQSIEAKVSPPCIPPIPPLPPGSPPLPMN